MSGHALPPGSLAAVVSEQTKTSPLSCYQCGRCAAGCFQNVPGEMEVSPTRLMRLVQLEATFHGEPAGEEYARRALTADTCWLCAGCMACTTRCPQGVDIAGTMDTLRQEGMKRGMTSRTKRARDIQALHKVFLGGALRRGRIHEFFLVLFYKMRTGHFFADATVAPTMLRKGKLHILPEPAHNTDRVRAAIETFRREEAAASHSEKAHA
jgi:heterodisulfide reductase subunit C